MAARYHDNNILLQREQQNLTNIVIVHIKNIFRSIPIRIITDLCYLL